LLFATETRLGPAPLDWDCIVSMAQVLAGGLTNVSSCACAMSAAGRRVTLVLPGGACEGSEGFLSPNRSRAQIAMLNINRGGRPLHEHVGDLIERSRPA
jgi:hypothetical protein